MNNLVIFGDSPFAERIAKYILFEKQLRLLCFTQEDKFCSRKSILNLPVIPLSELRKTVDCNFEIIIAIGYQQMNNLRKKIYKLLVDSGYKLGVWISNNAVVYSEKIGEGTMVLPHAMIGPGCELGKCNFIASSVVLSHDNVVGDYNFVSTNAVLGGGAKINNNCFLGLNCTIKNSIEIADASLIGSATNVLKSTEPFGVYVGNPARKLARKSTECRI